MSMPMFWKLQVFYIIIALLLLIIPTLLINKEWQKLQNIYKLLNIYKYIYKTNHTLSKKIKIEFIVLKWTFWTKNIQENKKMLMASSRVFSRPVGMLAIK